MHYATYLNSLRASVYSRLLAISSFFNGRRERGAVLGPSPSPPPGGISRGGGGSDRPAAEWDVRAAPAAGHYPSSALPPQAAAGAGDGGGRRQRRRVTEADVGRLVASAAASLQDMERRLAAVAARRRAAAASAAQHAPHESAGVELATARDGPLRRFRSAEGSPGGHAARRGYLGGSPGAGPGDAEGTLKDDDYWEVLAGSLPPSAEEERTPPPPPRRVPHPAAVPAGRRLWFTAAAPLAQVPARDAAEHFASPSVLGQGRVWGLSSRVWCEERVFRVSLTPCSLHSLVRGEGRCEERVRSVGVWDIRAQASLCPPTSPPLSPPSLSLTPYSLHSRRHRRECAALQRLRGRRQRRDRDGPNGPAG